VHEINNNFEMPRKPQDVSRSIVGIFAQQWAIVDKTLFDALILKKIFVVRKDSKMIKIFLTI
jgi:hypothetical protein